MGAQPRHKFSSAEKIEILLRQAICPLCGKPLGQAFGLAYDHERALGRGGKDEISNVRAVHQDCHSAKTFGHGATTRGSDVGEIAKTRRLTKKQEDFRHRLLAKDEGEKLPPRRWPSRPFNRRTYP